MNLIIYLSMCVWTLCLAEDNQFRFDYTYHQGAEGWLKLHRIPATWNDARLTCYYEGAVLASPENENLRAALQYTITDQQQPGGSLRSCGIFTGVHATFGKGAYLSIGGTPLSRMPVEWAPGEPDNADNSEDCLLMLPNGTLADVNCSEVFPYVCFRKKTSHTVLSDCGTVDTGYALDNRTRSCYKFHTEPQVWGKAFAACFGEGGYLAIINSATEAQVLKELFDKHPPKNIPGNFDKEITLIGHIEWNHQLWMTVHGQTLEEAGYAVWSPNQPDHKYTDTWIPCGAMFRSGQLDDTGCTMPASFICEKDPGSLLPK